MVNDVFKVSLLLPNHWNAGDCILIGGVCIAVSHHGSVLFDAV